MKLHRVSSLIVAVISMVSVALGQNPASTTQPAPRPVNPALVEVEDVPGLPRVLLIGDSISIGYTLPVRAKLKGIANVHRPTENCMDTTYGLACLDAWLGKGKWDVIHFNFGLHDLKYLNEKNEYVAPDKGKQVAPPETYRQILREFTERLKATGAKVIFATTTPVPAGTLARVAGDEKIYNKIAVEVMNELNVPIDDLCAFVADQQAKVPQRALSEKSAPDAQKIRPGEIQLPFDVHFTGPGYEQMANLVVASIQKVLKPH